MSKRANLADPTAMRLIVLIGRGLSVGAAAREMGIAQSNASRCLARYERLSGLNLVERSATGSRLTAQGELVATWAEEVIGRMDEFTRAVASLTAEVGSQLKVGASQTIAEYLAPRWLATFHREHPDTEVTLSVANSEATLEAVGKSKVDIGFIESPASVSNLRVTMLLTDELVLVVAPSHPWARRTRPVIAAELAATELVVRERGSGTRGTLDVLLDAHRRVDPALEVSSNAAVVGSIIAGLGPGVLSRLVVESALQNGELVAVPTTGIDLRRPLRVVWPDAPLRGPAADFLHVVRHDLARPRKLGPGLQS